MTETEKKPKTPRCPACGGALERYSGENPHKLDTGYCVKDGRFPLTETATTS